jgi:pyrroline-5-carboxylate reductase
MTQACELGLIGAGNMAEAIARAAIAKGVLTADSMIASDPSPDRRAVFESIGIRTTTDNAEVAARSRQMMLAVKPQMFAAVAASLHAFDGVVISIMAGITTAKMAQAIGRQARIVRVMPNTPLMAGAGMAGVALGEHARAGDEQLTLQLFGAAGEAIVVPEAAIDAITAVSGSGPAYVFYLAEAMQRAAADLGLGEHARMLVRQTIFGAAKLLHESADPPDVLRRKVTSPGGTTEAAIRHMDTRGVSDAVVEAINAAHARSIELGR